MHEPGGFDHLRATYEVERAHGRAGDGRPGGAENWRAPFWLLVVGVVLAVVVLVGMVVLASAG